MHISKEHFDITINILRDLNNLKVRWTIKLNAVELFYCKIIVNLNHLININMFITANSKDVSFNELNRKYFLIIDLDFMD